MKKKLLATLMMVTIVVSMLPICSFASTTKQKEFVQKLIDEKMSAKPNQFVVDDPYDECGDDDWIHIHSPSNYSTYYLGEILKIKWEVFDTWEEYYTQPGVAITDENDELIDCWFADDYVENYEWTDFITTYKIDEYLPEGIYTFWLFAPPTVGESFDDMYYNDDEIPVEYLDIEFRQLDEPSNIKAIAGKKKVTIKWKGVSAATKYQVYRSSSEYGSYKKIGTVSKKTFIDKKAKKGKRYYYKVRAMRTKRGTAYSYFSYPKRSGKVK